MKRILLAAVLFAGVILAAGEKILVWEASAPGLPGKAYLAGSIHSGKAQWYPLDSAYDRALDAASAVYFEIYQPDQQEVAQKTLIYGVFRNGKTLSQVLGMADFQRVCTFYAAYSPGMNAAVLERFRPWLLSIHLSQFYFAQHPEINRNFGMENVFAKHLGNKSARSLETIDGQLQAISAVSDVASGRVLMEGIQDFSRADEELNRIFRALESGVPDELARFANEMAFKHPEFHRELFLNRNRRIAEQIYSMLKEKQTVFILVGAGHLAGTGNILEYLREKGCRTVQLPRLGKPGRIRP